MQLCLRLFNMISGIGSVAVLVNDARRSAEWYRDKLGFEIVVMEGHSVFVKPQGSSFPLVHLCGKCHDWGNDKPGGRTGIWLNCGKIIFHKRKDSEQMIPASDPANVEETFQELRRKGAEFSTDITTTDWGKMAILRDPDGNELELS